MKSKYYVLKGKTNKYMSIYMRIWESKKVDQKCKTGIQTLIDDWSPTKERIKTNSLIKNKDFINHQLENLERYIYDCFIKDYNNKSYISKDWLKTNISNFFGRVSNDENYKVYYLDWVEKFVNSAHKRLHNGEPIKERTLKNYTSALNKLKSFEEYQKHKYRFEEIDLNFHRDFIYYCTTIEKLSPNSVGSLIARIKTFCRNIELDELPINAKYKHREFYVPKEETKDIYLTEDEINQIFNHDFSENHLLDSTRDLFIIGLRTGLRVSDFLNITSENILGNVINITTKKTKQNLTIPIHPQFESILQKRNGSFPNQMNDADFNENIKLVCKELKINLKTYGAKVDKESKRKKIGYYEKWELVTSHICRRSFATNLFLAGFDNSTIMKATGHKSEKQFLNYVKASQEEHIKKISDYWNNNL